MSLPVPFYDNPASVVGRSFEFTSGNIALQGCRGDVLRVEAASNAAGILGHIVIHTLQDGNTYRTRWSYFREHADLQGC
jgi:hypothetical protein